MSRQVIYTSLSPSLWLVGAFPPLLENFELAQIQISFGPVPGMC